jgi:putative transposase
MNNLEYHYAYNRHLPHIQPPGATFFITFRLVGSVPKKVLARWADEHLALERLLTKHSQAEGEKQRLAAFRRRFRELEQCLDAADTGPLWLKDDAVAKLLTESIHYRDGQVYRLDAFCIMANHVHLVIAPLPSGVEYYSLAKIMHSLKLYTARRANLLLNREGQFWEHESFDHFIRDEAEQQRIVEYVLNNPVKAGIVSSWRDWPHSYCR